MTKKQRIEEKIKMLENGITATEQMTDKIHVFEPAHIVRRHKTVADTDRISVHSALVISAHQAVHVEFREIYILFFLQQRVFDDAFFNADDPRHEGILHECDTLMLDVIEGAALQILYQMWRNLKHSADFFHIVFPIRKELRILRRQRYRLILHSFFEDCNAVSVS